jgi:hypothetical protein
MNTTYAKMPENDAGDWVIGHFDSRMVGWN